MTQDATPPGVPDATPPGRDGLRVLGWDSGRPAAGLRRTVSRRGVQLELSPGQPRPRPSGDDHNDGL